MSRTRPVRLTADSFRREILDGAGAALVAFQAERCGACDALATVIQDLAVAFAGRATVAVADVHQQPQLAAAYGIRATPSVLFFRDGVLVHQVSGVVPQPVLAARLESVIAAEETA